MLRSPLANLDTTPATPGLIGVVAVLFGSTAFDAFRDSDPVADVHPGQRRTSTYLAEQPRPARLLPRRRRRSSGSPASATGVGLDQSRRQLPNLFAHSLIPIVTGYIVAHYLSFFVAIGTQTLARRATR